MLSRKEVNPRELREPASRQMRLSGFTKLERFHSKKFEKKIVFDFHKIEMCKSYPCKKLVYKISELKLVINVQF